MSDIKFTVDHEWIKIQDDDSAVMGITEFAQEQLGDVVFVELPAAGTHFDVGDEVAVIESVKAASEIKMPVNGTVKETNTALEDEPEKVNADAMGEGWFIIFEPDNADDITALLDEAAYKESLEA